MTARRQSLADDGTNSRGSAKTRQFDARRSRKRVMPLSARSFREHSDAVETRNSPKMVDRILR